MVHKTCKYVGAFIEYDSVDEFFYKKAYKKKCINGRYKNIVDHECIKLYHKGKFKAMSHVWDKDGKEYININTDIVYLKDIKTLVPKNICIENLCEKHEVTFEEIKGDNLKGRLREPRNIMYHILREQYELTYQDIADMLCRKSHASVMSGNKRTKGFMDLSSNYTSFIESFILTEYRDKRY